jgi:hypothetical protein
MGVLLMVSKFPGERLWNPLWPVALPVAICLLDVAATLYGQPEAYWQGQYGKTIEENPLGKVFLEFHPWAFAIGALVWAGCFAAFILVAPRRLALDASLLITAGHTIGTCSWFSRIFHLWFLADVVFCLAVLVLSVPLWRARLNASLPPEESTSLAPPKILPAPDRTRLVEAILNTPQ